jgi:lipopolysaccharide transport protein LptA
VLVASAFSALFAASGASAGPDLPPFGLGAFDRAEPISISADQLEAQDHDDGRTLAFRRSVQVNQGPLSLAADELRAVYAAGESQPRELEAHGHVRIREGTRRAQCDDVRYDRPGQSIVCRGKPAELWDGEDRLAGGEIAFDLARKTVQRGARNRGRDPSRAHRGRARQGSASDPEVLERVRGKGPLAIRADTLLASDPVDTERRHLVRRRRRARGRATSSCTRASSRRSTRRARLSPTGLIARDDVTLRQGQREARCARAEYRLADRHLTCEGDRGAAGRRRSARGRADRRSTSVRRRSTRAGARGSRCSR